MTESDDPTTTGDPEVDHALRALDTLADLPVADHAAVFEDAHRALQNRLADEQE